MASQPGGIRGSSDGGRANGGGRGEGDGRWNAAASKAGGEASRWGHDGERSAGTPDPALKPQPGADGPLPQAQPPNTPADDGMTDHIKLDKEPSALENLINWIGTSGVNLDHVGSHSASAGGP